MSQLTEDRRSEEGSAVCAAKVGDPESSGEMGGVQRPQRAHRRPFNSDRNRDIGSYLLGGLLLLIVIGGLGMIMKGCAEFGSPFVSEPLRLPPSSGSKMR